MEVFMKENKNIFITIGRWFKHHSRVLIGATVALVIIVSSLIVGMIQENEQLENDNNSVSVEVEDRLSDVEAQLT
jgi:CHASE1-domain containing sensor protein